VGLSCARRYFGEGALLADKARRASAFAVGPTVLLALGRAALARAMGHQRAHANHATRAGAASAKAPSAPSAGLHGAFDARRAAHAAGKVARINFRDLAPLRVLREGAWGRELVVRHGGGGAVATGGRGRAAGGRVLALRALSKRALLARPGAVAALLNERDLLFELHHCSIKNLLRTFHDAVAVYALSDPVGGGDLFARLRAHGGGRGLPPAHARFYAASVLVALDYVHSRGVVHRDVRPENLGVTRAGFVKLANFALAKKLGDGRRTFTLCGTPPVEILRNTFYFFKIETRCFAHSYGPDPDSC